jgi:outer membrane lipoprotein-sorting protein
MHKVGGSFPMAVRMKIACSIFLSLLAAVACESAQTEIPAPTTETIVDHMTQARAENRTHFRSYIVTRDYKLFDEQSNQAKSRVIAEISFVPPDFKGYAITHANGSGLGEKIVHRMLDGEVAFAKDYSSTDISQDNYDFRFTGEDDVNGQHCYVLRLLPRRKDKNLLRGNIWVDVNTYLLHRAEGEPAKSPSWWLRDLRIVLLYGDVGGMWLQTSSEATADVRILGQSTVVSHDVRYQIGRLSPLESLAQKSFP